MAIAASAHSVNRRLAGLTGRRSYRPGPQFGSTVPRGPRVFVTQERTTCDCTIWINKSSARPSVPKTGILKQIRRQGLVETTHHEIKSFSRAGYPAQLHQVSMTQGRGGWIKPKYGYEHDDKVKNNGYVSTAASYSWTTNLPGAYKDTRASDGTEYLDFTIGTMFTWLLDSSKTYVIDTEVRAPRNGKPISSKARLTAQVLPYNGAFSASQAALANGCKFQLDPSRGNTSPQQGIGNHAWCTGIGFQENAQTRAVSYISLKPFKISYAGTCRHWTYGQGAKKC